MKYHENHFFFKRHAELLDTHIHVWGSGLLLPCYDMSFPYADLAPDPRKVKISDRFIFLPLMAMTLVSVLLFLLTGFLGDTISYNPMALFVVLTSLLGIITLVAIFTRGWWWLYVNGYGQVCFAISRISNSADNCDKFNAALIDRIRSAKKPNPAVSA